MMGARALDAPKVIGKQVFGSLYECDVEALRDEETIREVVIRAVSEGNMTLLDIRGWKIGEGVSVVAIILESHITVHTWPEYRFATVDVYSCGAHTDPVAAFKYIATKLNAKRFSMNQTDRSSDF
ncbi:adenosylmethionine decarboxylase [Sulfodiicoccus acidiphilus]|nr:adenosylmethionine decarboxylase [Sulfodiicoccus acidiphilus]